MFRFGGLQAPADALESPRTEQRGRPLRVRPVDELGKLPLRSNGVAAVIVFIGTTCEDDAHRAH